MHPRKIAAANAILFFFFWLLVLLAGADFPPPRGFLWLLLVLVLCALLVYWRIPTYIDWYSNKRPGRRWRVVLDGFLAGFVVAAASALRGSSEPAASLQTIDYAIWFAVLSVLGMLNSVVLYTINALVVHRQGSG